MVRRTSGDAAEPAGTLRMLEDDYSHGTERPLGSYGLLLGTYAVTVTGLALAARARGVRLPDRIGVADAALLAVGTFRASRLVTKDSVTAVARAPFTRFEEPAGRGEVNEEVVGRGPRHAIGELVSCPFCISVWVATAGLFGIVARPRLTRAVCTMLGAVTVSDALQFGFAALQKLE